MEALQIYTLTKSYNFFIYLFNGEKPQHTHFRNGLLKFKF